MTTALIGKHGEQATKARVAVLTRHTGSGLTTALARAGHDALECHDWDAVGAGANAAPFDLVLCDDETASESPRDYGCPVLVVGDRPGTGSISQGALEAAIDTVLALATALARSRARCSELEQLTHGLRSGAAMVGRSPMMRRLMTAISRAADCDATTLVEGPAGAGKSLTARMIHCKSRRSNHQLASLEAGATTPEQLTKALESARGSTLLIEDVEKLSAPSQAQLVRHLKERNASTPGTGVRLIATTSAHLPELVARGAFREDLFYRLHSMPIVVPSLRERTEDIALLAQAALQTTVTGSARLPTITASAMSALETMTWPGNVTQLEAVVRRAHVLAGGGAIERDHVSAPTVTPVLSSSVGHVAAAAEPDDNQAPTEESILPFEQEEQRMLSRALQATKGNVRRAAQLLGIGRATLYRKIQQYQLRLQ